MEITKLSETDFVELRQFIDRLGVERIAFGTDYPLFTNSKDYINVLENKLGLNKEELNIILTRK
jgi:predicted TIM-barrel fold metal-dependent hydrolase